MLQGPVRHPAIAAFALLLTAACADAPITAADIQADGQLRQTPSPSQQSVHAASEHQPKAQTAEHLRVTGLLAAQADGPLEDATRFSLDSEAIYLHLRADDLSEPRPVTFVWTHREDEYRRETMGFLQPAETISLAASLPLAQYTDPESVLEVVGERADGQWTATGEWKLEVYSTDSHRSLLFERDFEVIEAEAYQAMLLADASAAEDFD